MDFHCGATVETFVGHSLLALALGQPGAALGTTARPPSLPVRPVASHRGRPPDGPRTMDHENLYFYVFFDFLIYFLGFGVYF